MLFDFLCYPCIWTQLILLRNAWRKCFTLRKRVQADLSKYKAELRYFEALFGKLNGKMYRSALVYHYLDLFLDERYFQYLCKANEKSPAERAEIHLKYARKRLESKFFFPEGKSNFNIYQSMKIYTYSFLFRQERIFVTFLVVRLIYFTYKFTIINM